MGDASAAAANAIQVDWRLWLLAAVSTASFLLGLFNAWRSSNITRESRENRDQIQELEARQRERVIRLEEFRTSVRDPVRATLPALKSLGKRFAALSKTRISLDSQRDDLLELNTEVTAALGAVYDALSDANESQFADGAAWTDGIEDTQDQISAFLNCVLDDKSPQIDRLKSISDISEKLLSLRAEMNARLEAALRVFAEESAVSPN